MNQDIVYEIVRCLYLCPEENGGALLAKKVILSQKPYKKFDLAKFEKPIVFTIKGNLLVPRSKIDFGATIYWGDGTKYKCEKDEKTPDHIYPMNDLYVVKIFEHIHYLIMPQNVHDVHSIGSIITLSCMFNDLNDYNKKVGTKWDTSGVLRMNGVFSRCTALNKNVGRNWNTQNVINLDFMFRDCTSLNKNIGKNWDVSNVTDVSYMFFGCKSLEKSVGKNWVFKGTICAEQIFFGCKGVDLSVLSNWKIDCFLVRFLMK
jgi:surface protein